MPYFKNTVFNRTSLVAASVILPCCNSLYQQFFISGRMRRRSESFSSCDFSLNLDPQCIIMRGYLIKSPPLEKARNRVARWHLRWFMLYDTKKRCDIDPLLEREIKLYYFKDEHSPGKEKPKGMLIKKKKKTKSKNTLILVLYFIVWLSPLWKKNSISPFISPFISPSISPFISPFTIFFYKTVKIFKTIVTYLHIQSI